MKTKMHDFFIHVIIMCCRKKMFSKVKFRNNIIIPIKDRDKVSIKLINESQNFISMLYVSSKSIKYGGNFFKKD